MCKLLMLRQSLNSLNAAARDVWVRGPQETRRLAGKSGNSSGIHNGAGTGDMEA